jgi:hypothetical protein
VRPASAHPLVPGHVPVVGLLLILSVVRFSCCCLQVVAEQPERLRALLQLTHYSLAAAVRHDLEVMLPLFGLYLPGSWQLTTDCLASSHRLLSACKACSAAHGLSLGAAAGSGSSAAAAAAEEGGNSHLGPPLASVLHALLDSLPTAWQCYQQHLQQWLQQQRLYMASLDADESAAGGSQGALLTGSQQQLSQGSTRAERVLNAELQSKQKWVVHLLQLGGELHTLRSSSSSGSGSSRRSSIGFGSGSGGASGSAAAACSECFVAAVAEQQLLQAWRAALEGVVRVTSTPWSKVGIWPLVFD